MLLCNSSFIPNRRRIFNWKMILDIVDDKNKKQTTDKNKNRDEDRKNKLDQIIYNCWIIKCE